MTGFEFIAKAFKVSYTDIAKRLNMTPSAIADWASGRRPIPNDKLPLVSKLFRIDEEYFKKKE
ncbi:helix-turn-helix domain-containing protein [Paenibacillus alba]|uniref:helix-turn-helix domain-containing protein n=1 Tax=Paenibacillus alba TaxID=1197127 RepID=UPI001565E662|nr:helix-turn-helix domain-containing protein [Paenibacillus alba]NQX64616.1 helix-turn-helix domain-containing protein [Paenibacillus alba]